MQLTAGDAKSLGAQVKENGVNFALFSAHAEQVELCVFDDEGNEQRLSLPARTGDVWHGFLEGAKPGLRYGYRLHGPWQPAKGHRFNPAKLLIDPYARRVEGEPVDSPLFHSGYEAPSPLDNASVAPKSVVVDAPYDWQDDAPPRTPWGNTVIYEAHVKGLTWLHPELPPEIRGTYKALGHPVMIDWFKRLGITAIELLPIASFASEPRLQRLGLSNYWGYNPLAIFALELTYASEPQNAINELRDAVKALHQAGIEVILDIVLNHTAELDVHGPTFSLLGIDNTVYYWLTNEGDYINWTGCGNTLNCRNPVVVEYLHDCLRYWVETFHVDGFRFDLASVLGRTPDFNPQAPLLEMIRNDPALNTLKLIAEPWDVGSGGYQVGNFLPPFAEWNDLFRDGMRRFWLEHSLSLGDFAQRFAASSNTYKRNERPPSSSVNFITAHDGFTLRDVVSFNHKHNEANGENNRDGAAVNHSNNHGVEGLQADENILQRRRKSMEALLTSLLLAQGTPMLLAGDEMGHSQQGNNNAYCQDNALTWLDWAQADYGLADFIAALIRLRQQIPALTSNNWWEEGDGNVVWLNSQGQPLKADEWRREGHRIQILLSGTVLLLINATLEEAQFTLPEGEWLGVPPFAGDDNPVSISVWHGPTHGVSVLRRSKKKE